MSGFVSLVGAGPGDTELLTVKAVRRLAEADVVLYDALVPEDVLALAPRAHRFYVGKRAGHHAMEQRLIEALLIREAKRGKRVVRLKCGDPYVFGRGGEEALALVDAGIAFEVIPGVSTAVAAPEIFGIPVTHRGLASAYAVVSGHTETVYGPILAGIAPHSLTLVVLMGLAQRAKLAAHLQASGWRASTPTAMVLGAYTANAWLWTGTLGELPGAAIPELVRGAPGTLVIGAVVSLAARLGQSQNPPLPLASA